MLHCYQVVSNNFNIESPCKVKWGTAGGICFLSELRGCSTSSLQLLTDGGSHIITHFRSVSNSLWWISIFTRHFVNSILVLPLGPHVRLPGLPAESSPVLWNVRSLMEGQGWHWFRTLIRCKSKECKLGQDFTFKWINSLELNSAWR